MKTAPDRQTRTVPFEAPGPGSWELDYSHFDANCSRIVRDAMEVGMYEGMELGMSRVGAPVRTVEAAFVNGRFYHRLVPVVGGNHNLPEPPAVVLKIATRLHPELRRRNKLAAATLENRSWNEELDRWQREWKPELIATSRRLDVVDLHKLDDWELTRQLNSAVAHMTAGLALHFRLHVSDLGPIGLLLVRAREWGLDMTEAMQALSGYSYATSAPANAMAKVRRNLPGGHLAALADLEHSPEEARLAYRAFIDEYGSRLTEGYDIRAATLGELPDTILAGINSASLEGDRSADAKAIGDETARRLREQVPVRDQTEFDHVVADARALYGLRDENGPITYQWPAGIVRRAVLEAGKRFHRSGALHADDHVFELSLAEIVGELDHSTRVDPDEAARRAAVSAEWCTLEAPPTLGPASELPPIDVLPGPLARLMDMTLTVMELLESPPDRPELVGVGIGTETFTGRARVVSDAIDALSHFEPNDILVAPFTVPTINSVLAMAGAVVVEQGGLLCHAAVIAREFGVPGVVGVAGATSQIPDGATIEVDATNGTVRIV